VKLSHCAYSSHEPHVRHWRVKKRRQSRARQCRLHIKGKRSWFGRIMFLLMVLPSLDAVIQRAKRQPQGISLEKFTKVHHEITKAEIACRQHLPKLNLKTCEALKSS
jgi:hypothetical protein